MVKRSAAMQRYWRKRFERAQSVGDLPRSADLADLARHVATVSHGMAVQAAGGAGGDERTASPRWPRGRGPIEFDAGWSHFDRLLEPTADSEHLSQSDRRFSAWNPAHRLPNRMAKHYTQTITDSD